MATFTEPPEVTVLHGREEIGCTDPVLFADKGGRTATAAAA